MTCYVKIYVIFSPYSNLNLVLILRTLYPQLTLLIESSIVPEEDLNPKIKKPISEDIQQNKDNNPGNAIVEPSHHADRSDERKDAPADESTHFEGILVEYIEKYLEQRSIIAQQNRPSWWLVGLTFLLVLVGMMSNIFTCRQISIQKENAVTELRAYVYPDRVGIRGVHIGIIPTVPYQIKNFGKTPAYKVNVSYGITTDKTFLPHYIDSMKTIQSDTGFILSPDAISSWDVFFPYAIERGDSADLANIPDYSFYFVMGIVYEDNFALTHHSIFGYVYDKNRTHELVKLRQYQFAD